MQMMLCSEFAVKQEFITTYKQTLLQLDLSVFFTLSYLICELTLPVKKKQQQAFEKFI